MNPQYELKPDKILEFWKRSSSRKKSEVLEYITLPILITNKQGTILDINTHASMLMEYNKEDIIDKDIYDFCLPEQKEFNYKSFINNQGAYQFVNGKGESRYYFVNTHKYKDILLHLFVDSAGNISPEEALLISEQRYRSLIDNAVDGIYIMNMERFLYVNDRLCEILGYPKEELLSINPWDLLKKEKRSLFMEKAKKNYKKLKIFKDHREIPYLRKDGKTITCEVGYCSTIYQGQYAFQGNVKDITEKKLIEVELKESEEKYRKVVDRAFDGIAIIDENKLIYANNRFSNYLGYANNEILDMNENIWSIVHPKDIERLKEIINYYIKNDATHTYNLVDVLTKTGEVLTCEFGISNINIQGEPAALIVARDITSKLRKYEKKRYDTTKINHINKVLKILAESQNTVEAYQKFLKVMNDEFSDCYFQIVIKEENLVKAYSLRDYELSICSMEDNLIKDTKYVVTRKIIKQNRCDMYFNDLGCIYITEIPISGLAESFGIFRFGYNDRTDKVKHQMIVEIIKDVSLTFQTLIYRDKITQINREKAQEEKNKLLNKFTLIGEIATTIAHEVRNPMTTVKGLAQLLMQEETDKTHYYELMVEEIDRANMIITEFLRLSKNTLFKKEQLKLKETLVNTLEVFNSEIQSKNITIDFSHNDDNILVFGDKEQLKQSFSNIIKNALDASQENSRIIINLMCVNKMAVIQIIDSGQGINSSIYQQIMEPFFTTKENNIGLGLPITYKIIKDHGGEIYIDSKENHGTTIEIHIPLLTTFVA